MKRPTSVRRAGPYQVHSCADGSLQVVPDWPAFPKYTNETGGGAGVLSRMALARDLERWLNATLPVSTGGTS